MSRGDRVWIGCTRCPHSWEKHSEDDVHCWACGNAPEKCVDGELCAVPDTLETFCSGCNGWCRGESETHHEGDEEPPDFNDWYAAQRKR